MATVETLTLGRGIYGLSEASYLLGIDERTIARWSRRTPSGKEALVAPSHGFAFSFHDLLSLAVIAVFRQRNITPDGIRRAIVYLQDEFETSRPLANKGVVDALQTAGGGSVLLGPGIDVTRSGQMAILQTVQAYLRPISYGADRLARLWKPARYVLLNPEIQAGRPCIPGTRVTTDVVAGRVNQGELPDEVARDLQLRVDQVRAAERWESELERGKGLALVA